MADQVEHQGRLIAIDGTRGKDIGAAAAAVIDALKQRSVACAISRFDASGLFGELTAAGRGDRNISARTLTLVYAADLAFRLRWEIRPVLESGGIVIAAPYTETAIAFGSAAGLEEAWIRELLRFAPKPGYRSRAEEKKVGRGWKPRLDRGYAEYCVAMLGASSQKVARKRVRRDAMALLHRPKERKIYRLTDNGVAELVKAVTGNRRDAARRSTSKLRNGRS
ncbi:MAG TPA: hypothetical protein VF057_00525 [Thermoanaerobaculia bacterium]